MLSSLIIVLACQTLFVSGSSVYKLDDVLGYNNGQPVEKTFPEGEM
jgi:hypothetical protein